MHRRQEIIHTQASFPLTNNWRWWWKESVNTSTMQYKHLMHYKVKLHSATMVKIIKDSKPLPLINASKAIKKQKRKNENENSPCPCKKETHPLMQSSAIGNDDDHQGVPDTLTDDGRAWEHDDAHIGYHDLVDNAYNQQFAMMMEESTSTMEYVH